MDAKILQKLNEIDREFKSMERFRLSMAKSRKKRIMKRIKKGAPVDYKGIKKNLLLVLKLIYHVLINPLKLTLKY